MQKYTTVYLKKLVSDINFKRGYGRNPVYSTIGAIDLDWAYGGVKVIEYISNNKAKQELSSHGYGTKKEAGLFLEGMNHD